MRKGIGHYCPNYAVVALDVAHRHCRDAGHLLPDGLIVRWVQGLEDACAFCHQVDGHFEVCVDVSVPVEAVPELVMHELAHVITWDKDCAHPDEHSEEWKALFAGLMESWWRHLDQYRSLAPAFATEEAYEKAQAESRKATA